MSDSCFLSLNETTLFFHTYRFKTPDTKKHRNKELLGWSKGVTQLPVLALPHKKRSKTTASGHSSTNTITALVGPVSSAHTCVATASTMATLVNKLGRKRKHDDLEPNNDEPDVPTTAYGGLQDEDDTLEELAALASPLKAQEAAQKSEASITPALPHPILTHNHESQANVIIEPGITANKRLPKRLGNSSLPDGANDGGKWTVTFRQTYLKYLGGLNEEIWGLSDRETVRVLQTIWNEVYKGNERARVPRLSYVVKRGDAVFQTVKSLLPSL
jgi:hypothetical protein